MTCYRVQLFVLLIPTMMACSEPKCPANLIQQGTVCKRCPEGSEKRGNQCIDVDSGEGVGTTDVSDEAPTDLDEDEGGARGALKTTKAELGRRMPAQTQMTHPATRIWTETESAQVPRSSATTETALVCTNRDPTLIATITRYGAPPV